MRKFQHSQFLFSLHMMELNHCHFTKAWISVKNHSLHNKACWSKVDEYNHSLTVKNFPDAWCKISKPYLILSFVSYLYTNQDENTTIPVKLYSLLPLSTSNSELHKRSRTPVCSKVCGLHGGFYAELWIHTSPATPLGTNNTCYIHTYYIVHVVASNSSFSYDIPIWIIVQIMDCCFDQLLYTSVASYSRAIDNSGTIFCTCV